MEFDFRFLGYSKEDQERFEPIILHRCFGGWEKIKDQYSSPGDDGDIVLFIHKKFTDDIKDAKFIIKYLQEGTDEPSAHDQNGILPVTSDIVHHRAKGRFSMEEGLISIDGEKCKYYCSPSCHPDQVGPEWVYGCTHEAWPQNRYGDFCPIVKCGGDPRKCSIPPKFLNRMIKGRELRIRNAIGKTCEWGADITEFQTLLGRESSSE